MLCEEERKKGFVRPYRDSYRHVGLKVCGAPVWDGVQPPVGFHGYVCSQPPGHTEPCGQEARAVVTAVEAARVAETHTIGRCNTVTTMGRALSETYARDPKFYGSTFCVSCNHHFPVAEFVWVADGEVVGS